MSVVVLGASPKPDRYSYKAIQALLAQGYDVIPVHPVVKKIDELDVLNNLSDRSAPVDTITMYVNAQKSDTLADDIIGLSPRRIIFNPGAENADLAARCQAAGIEVLNACTLVMLGTGQF